MMYSVVVRGPEDGHPCGAEVGEHPCRHGVKGVPQALAPLEQDLGEERKKGINAISQISPTQPNWK